jgi:hypothetical protein
VAAGGWPKVYRVLRPGALFWLDHVSDFASVSFSLPAHTSTHLHALDSDCRIMWAAAVTHKKFTARCGLPQIALIMCAAVADAGRAVHRRPICILRLDRLAVSFLFHCLRTHSLQ